MTKEKKPKTANKDSKNNEEMNCKDLRCPVHGSLSVRGRIFQGKVVKIKKTNLKIETERVVYIPKYERYLKKKTSLHAHLPECLFKEIKIGDIIEIGECRPLSKTIHHVVVKIAKKISEREREIEEEKMEKELEKRKVKKTGEEKK
jgi:small subunit ribosomal protein S17